MHLPRGKNLIILTIAFIALAVPAILLERHILTHTNGSYVFPLDNAFLDISTAKTFAYHSVWGISKNNFQYATASILYPLILAAIFFITGAHLVIPIFVNTLAAALFLYCFQKMLTDRNVKPVTQLAVLLTVIVITALPVLVISGMSYALQLLFCFLFINSLARSLEKEATPFPRKLYYYGLCAVATQYEDILLIFLACILLLSLRRRAEAARLAGISSLPILIFGTISLTKGGYFLPNSIVLALHLDWPIALATISLGAGLLIIGRYRQMARRPALLYRVCFTLLILLSLPFTTRNLATLHNFQADCFRIYEQQYPIAAFVRRYYGRQTVGVTEIGAVAYFSEGGKMDYNGAASKDVIKSKRERSWEPTHIDYLSRIDGVRMVITSWPNVNTETFPKWFRVASWEIPDTHFSSGKTLTFFSVNNYDSAMLRRRLHDYESSLPSSVKVSYY